MGQIYKHCQRVLIYLAPELYPRWARYSPLRREEEHDTKALQESSFRDIVKHLVDFQACHFSSGKPPELLGADTIASIYLLFFHPWFFRGWVIQEMVLSPKAMVLTCGHEISVEFLEWFVDRANSSHWAGPGKKPPLPCVEDLRCRYKRLEFSPGHSRFRNMMKLKSSNSALQLLDTISTGSQFRLTVDHVFGLLGIMDYLDLAPNYSLAPHEVFTLTAASIIDAYGTLHVLEHLPRGEDLDALPSWVPYWPSTGVEKTTWTSGYDTTKLAACRNRKHILSAASAVPYLRVRGKRIDRVTRVGERWEAATSYVTLNKALLECVNNVVNVDPQLNVDYAMEILLVKLHRELPEPMQSSFYLFKAAALPDWGLRLLNSPRWLIEEWESVRLKYEAMVESEIQKRPLYPSLISSMHEAYEKLAEMWESLSRCTPFLVEGKRCGHAQPTLYIEPGDIVYILHGLNCPIILRQIQGGDADESGKLVYTVVGVCYLDGCMNGEAVTWEEDEAEEFLLI